MNPIDSKPNESPLQTYRRFLEQGVLAYQADSSTNRAFFYPRVIAPGSGNEQLEWHESEGIGTVYAVTVVYPKADAPYNIVLVDMAEGFRMMSRIDDIDAHEVNIGMRVRMCVQRDADGVPYPAFKLEEA
ncbi:hypothetical protein B0G69_7667 [Paraburkholderia sp. RAU2J]|uniref:Zn-ribbon domain-containing OB-fold protein n=1 Tax=Paraburkholderia sp. RAU2J TaxID=1938810 RepID=UPI000EB40D28|nr:OB-fold domain-containing protein [Paraburkholderia sp. RAU2J]RKT10303.1 hypothetical protein B0G69_7667 [Paraburkholderia sp. RAU2J]